MRGYTKAQRWLPDEKQGCFARVQNWEISVFTGLLGAVGKEDGMPAQAPGKRERGRRREGAVGRAAGFCSRS